MFHYRGSYFKRAMER